jgi:hypothetical protein
MSTGGPIGNPSSSTGAPTPPDPDVEVGEAEAGDGPSEGDADTVGVGSPIVHAPDPKLMFLNAVRLGKFQTERVWNEA